MTFYTVADSQAHDKNRVSFLSERAQPLAIIADAKKVRARCRRVDRTAVTPEVSPW